MRRIIVFFIFIAIPFLCVKAQVIDKSFILIDADSRVDIPAKEIAFSIVIDQLDTNAQQAYKMLKDVEKEFVKVLKDYKIPDTSVSYSLSQFQKEGGYNNQLMKYRASENIVVKFYNFKLYEPFQLSLLSIGIYSFHGTFSSTEIKEARELGFKKAIEKAEREAKIICHNIGRELGKVLEVESRNRDYVVSSNIQSLNATVEEPKLIDIPRYVTLNTNLKIKYELK
jgi:uncharacterized protein YggE